MKLPIINHNKTLKKIVHQDKLIKIMINKTIKMIYIKLFKTIKIVRGVLKNLQIL
jgi:hypothetical protein